MAHKYLYHLLLLVFIAFAMPVNSFAQKKDKKNKDDFTADELDPQTQELVEYIVEANDSEFDLTFLLERLEFYTKKPLQLNTATKEDLQDFGLLNDIQINNLINYREKFGELIAVYELQAIEGFDKRTIFGILPFVRVKGDIETFRVSPISMLHKGTNEVLIRYQRVLENQAGYDPDRTNGYLGDQNKYYARFRHQYENRHSWGITMEKDAGEEFFRGSNKKGFDFYSGHVYYRNLNKVVKGISLGDYVVSLGQGLVIGAGFGAGKSSQVMNIKARARTLKPYTSVAESNFRRGAAAHLAFGNIEVLGYVSTKSFDFGVLEVIDTNDIDIPGEIFITGGLDIDGLHRTQREVDRRNNVPIFETGGGAKFKFKPGHIGVHGSYMNINANYGRQTAPYNQFSLLDSVSNLTRVGADYNFIHQNFNFFGETAYSTNGGIATLNSLLIGLDRTVDLAILHRYYGRSYVNFFESPAFAESSNPNNEAGLFIGLQIKPNYNWTIAGYLDAYKHPWLRFRVDAPSRGIDYLVQINYRVKRKMEVYFRIKDETKNINAPPVINDDPFENDDKFDVLGTIRKTQLRFHLANKVSKTLELRNRAEYILFKKADNTMSKGFLVYQDVLVSPMGFPLSFKGRFAIFQTDDYDSRIYAYENDLIGSFSIPAYAHRGMRYYLNLRYKGIRNMTLEFRIAQTYQSYREDAQGNDISEEISSGTEQIDGRTRTEIKAQLKYKF